MSLFGELPQTSPADYQSMIDRIFVDLDRIRRDAIARNVPGVRAMKMDLDVAGICVGPYTSQRKPLPLADLTMREFMQLVKAGLRSAAVLILCVTIGLVVKAIWPEIDHERSPYWWPISILLILVWGTLWVDILISGASAALIRVSSGIARRSAWFRFIVTLGLLASWWGLATAPEPTFITLFFGVILAVRLHEAYSEIVDDRFAPRYS